MLTHKRLLLGMESHVGLQVGGSSKRLVTHHADIDLAICMQLGVLLEAAGVLEQLVAVVALVALLDVVDPLVLLQVIYS